MTAEAAGIAREDQTMNIAQPGTPLVVVLDDGYESTAIEEAVLLPLGARLEVRACGGNAEKVLQAVEGAAALLVRESPVGAAAMDLMPGCRAIVRYGVGYDNVDIEAARQRGIYVANVPDYGFEEVSDHAMALMLGVMRRVVTRDAEVRHGAWNVGRTQPVFRIAGKVLGLVGCGLIGRAFMRKAAGFGFSRILIADPGLQEAPPGAELAALDDVLELADVISLHVPLLASTRNIINRAALAKMKQGAVLINTSRGGLIDEEALVEALRTGKLFGAGIDVFETEPPRAEHPLFGLGNVIVTDHTAWYSEDAVKDLQRKAAEEVACVLRGEPPRNWVNRWGA